jgi:protein-S-isoprenylcysteine O-methyltransferase Ste14
MHRFTHKFIITKALRFTTTAMFLTSRLLVFIPFVLVARLTSTDAFTSPPSLSRRQQVSLYKYVSSTRKSNNEKLVPKVPDLTFDKAVSPVNEFINRFLAAGGGDDPVGTRGEGYFFLQAILIVAIVLGGIPIFGNYLEIIAGPGLMLVGVVVLIITALDMNESISPWPKPNGQGLVQNGLYGQMRHPMYFGVLSTMMGFSVMTGSIQRLLLTLLLYVAIDFKSNYEEEELAKTYGQVQYEEYKKKVKSKFVPKVWTELWK